MRTIHRPVLKDTLRTVQRDTFSNAQSHVTAKKEKENRIFSEIPWECKWADKVQRGKETQHDTRDFGVV